MKRIILTFLLMVFSTGAFAFHCPADAKAIDAGLSKANISDDHKSEIMALRDKGLAQHESGDHKDAEATLADAMRQLLNNMQ